VTWSNKPVIVTFGAGGGVCANTGSAGTAKMTKASTAVRTLLLITASSSGGEKHRSLSAPNADITNNSNCERGSERSERPSARVHSFPRQQFQGLREFQELGKSSNRCLKY
jgi:hypothetical protein